MQRVFIISLLLTSLLIAIPAATCAPSVEDYRETSEKKWAKAMAEFDKRNASEEHSPNALLFAGSSSIRLWKTIAEDMAPYETIQRGFGGSEWSDVAVHADRLIKPHEFRAAVFFVANDIRGRDGEGIEADKTPEEVAALVKFVREKVRHHRPKATVFVVAVTPTESRSSCWEEIQKGNELVRQYCEGEEATHFIKTADLYLDDDRKPRSELFQKDKLHLNRDGYRLWGKTIRAALDAVLSKK